MAIEFGQRPDPHGDGTRPSRDRGFVGERSARNGQWKRKGMGRLGAENDDWLRLPWISFYGKVNSIYSEKRISIKDVACRMLLGSAPVRRLT
jgi:hypothetical protein